MEFEDLWMEILSRGGDPGAYRVLKGAKEATVNKYSCHVGLRRSWSDLRGGSANKCYQIQGNSKDQGQKK